jgi:hypothetical protein
MENKSLNVPRVSGFEEFASFAKGAVDTVCWPDAYPYKPEVRFAIAHDGRALLIRFDVEEENPRAVTTRNNGPVWEDSCVEFFVKEPDSPYYFNFETNCIGAGLAAKRLSRGEFTHFDEARMAQVIRRSSFPPEPVDIHGKTAWSLELEIPFSLICEGAGVPSRLLANFYKCGDKTTVMHFLSWNPVRVPNPDFHRPEFFGELILKP